MYLKNDSLFKRRRLIFLALIVLTGLLVIVAVSQIFSNPKKSIVTQPLSFSDRVIEKLSACDSYSKKGNLECLYEQLGAVDLIVDDIEQCNEIYKFVAESKIFNKDTLDFFTQDHVVTSCEERFKYRKARETGNPDYCLNLEDSFEEWNCIEEAAIISGDESICDLRGEDKDGRKHQFYCKESARVTRAAQIKDLSLCESITDSSTRRECYGAVGIATLDSSLCERSEYRSPCYLEIAKNTGDVQYCDKIFTSDPYMSKLCYEDVAVTNKDASLCAKVPDYDEERINNCYVSTGIELSLTCDRWREKTAFDDHSLAMTQYRTQCFNDAQRFCYFSEDKQVTDTCFSAFKEVKESWED